MDERLIDDQVIAALRAQKKPVTAETYLRELRAQSDPPAARTKVRRLSPLEEDSVEALAEVLLGDRARTYANLARAYDEAAAQLTAKAATGAESQGPDLEALRRRIDALDWKLSRPCPA
jgi:hypothetical protein